VTSVSGIQKTYAELSGKSVKELTEKGIYPLQISKLAKDGDSSAANTFEVVNRSLARLLYERILTLNCGWQNLFEFGNPNRSVLNPQHQYLGKVFDAIIIGQRLGDLFDDETGKEVVRIPVFDQLNELIQNSTFLTDEVKQHYENLDEIIKISKLREAPALGAGIDAFITTN
ncbi:MAG: hypothetical protein R3182_14330, partial [Draconibacterium sp.]|nr:hypothetical protein [Draconibacterium sp.]